MFSYWKESLARRKARRITQEYPAKIEKFHIENIGDVEFANWSNPLVAHLKQLTVSSSIIGFFKQFIKEGDLAIDIGANIGDTTVPMGLCTGVSGLTIGFEPSPYVYKILQKNTTLNLDKANMVGFPHAISDVEDEFFYISSEASFSNGGISKTKESKHGKFVYPNKIKGVNLKKFLEENYSQWLDKLSFIKIDTEGYDKEILKSITDLISKYKPFIVAECFGGLTDEDKMELFEIIEKQGYDIYYVYEHDINAKVIKLETKKDITKWKETINIYATPKRK
jgi:FkbM family methyltransferase